MSSTATSLSTWMLLVPTNQTPAVVLRQFAAIAFKVAANYLSPPPNIPIMSLLEPICFIKFCNPPMPPICFNICGGRTLLICCAFMLRDKALISPFFGILSPFILLQILASRLYSSNISITSLTCRPDPLAIRIILESFMSFGLVLSNSVNR